jgi:GNAT superfamily N-acetyltransferase
VWLEDLFVRPANRGEGVGKALLEAVAALVRERGGERLEWAALDWNALALGFYRRLGAQTMNEWITHRLDGEALSDLATARR